MLKEEHLEMVIQGFLRVTFAGSGLVLGF
uniref:Uncharacterized protein n=1 Tax=Rhizophora mucronata TaxID=61149 RepID=A0A2P2PFW3_RHIMU